MAITYERLIYTAGTVKLTDAVRECRRILIWTDLLRKPPSAIYQNERMNPPKQFLGYVSLMIDDYVVKVFPLEYDHQIVLEWDNLAFQLYKAIICNTALLTENIVKLGTVMTPPALLIPITPVPNSFPGCPYVWLKFKLEPLTRIKVTVFADEALGCTGVTFPVTVPDLPPPPPPYPPTQPIEDDPARSEPYPDENPGDTKLADADDPDAGLPSEEFPIGQACDVYRIVVCAQPVGFPNPGCLSPRDVYGEIDFIGIDPADNTRLIVRCRGFAEANFQTCKPNLVTELLSGFSGGYVAGSVTYTATKIS